MNHYQDQTKKKPLIQFHQKLKYNQPTIPIKDKMKKDWSTQKQNTYENHHTNKRFKDYNLNMNIPNINGNKYNAQYTTNTNNQKDNGHQGYKKSVLQQNNNNTNTLSNGNITSPNNIESTFNNVTNTQKNLTFGLVKNTQQIHQQTQVITKQQQSNNILIDNQNIQNNHIISVNVNIQNLQNIQPNNNFINTQNLDGFKKINNSNKYEINNNLNKYETNNNTNKYEINKYDMKALIKKPQHILRINKNQNNLNNTKINLTSNILTQRYVQKTSFIQRNDRLQRKQKFKKQFQEKFNITSSPIDKDFLCQQQFDLKTIDIKNADKKQGPIFEKNPLLFQKKTSQKGLHLNNNNQLQQPQHSQINRFNKKIDKKTLQLKQLKQFESGQKQINLIECSLSIKVLFQQQQKYLINPCYLQKNQKAISWSIRAILVDWMRQLSQQYSLKRDTYHLAVILLDTFLSKKNNVQKQVAQVIGATTLFIASKLEQIQCRPSQSFAESTQGLCKDKDIKNWQLQICKTLQFRLNPPTISSLANRIMTQWDKFIDQVDYAIHHLSFQGKQKVYFKKMDQPSYKIFRHLMQFIDCQILDIQTYQYKPVLIVLSIMYLILGNKLGGFNNEDIYQNFPRGSYYLLDKTNYFNDLFQSFINSTFRLTLLQILPSVQYTATYFNLQLNFQKPLLGQNEQDLQQMNYQQYCSFQTYNRHMLKTVQNRFRGILNAF